MTIELTTEKKEINFNGVSQVIEISRKGAMSKTVVQIEGQAYTFNISLYNEELINRLFLGEFFKQNPQLKNESFKAITDMIFYEIRNDFQRESAIQRKVEDARISAWHKVAAEVNEEEAARLAIHNA